MCSTGNSLLHIILIITIDYVFIYSLMKSSCEFIYVLAFKVN